MHSAVYLGSICVLLEDLGFKAREPNQEIIKEMSYYYYAKYLYDKIFADIGQYKNITWVLEMNLTPEEICIDRWRKNGEGVYMISDEVVLDICDPRSIDLTTGFIERSISIARST